MAQAAQPKRNHERLPLAALATPHRFTVKQYHRMGEIGIFKPGDRVELIDGEIIEMSPIGSPHASRVKRLLSLFVRKLSNRAVIQVQDPVILNRFSEPQPDVAVLKPRADFYAECHPQPGDTLLVVEVSDTTRNYDRKVKLPLYARAGLPEVWIGDLIDAVIHVHRSPVGAWYRDVTEVGPGSACRSRPSRG